MANTLFYYFGDDEAYFRTLAGEFKKFTKLAIDFKRVFESDEAKIQSLFLKINKEKPQCVFIDFSKLPHDYLHLARIMARTKISSNLVTVGLVDYLSSTEVLLESIATGVNLTHIKGPECFDVVYGVTKLIAPNEIGEHGFATASLKEEWTGGVPVKIGYVHPEGLHFETNYPLSKGQRIKIQHHWMEKRTVPSQEAFIQDVSSKNLFYHFGHAVDAEFLFIDEFLPSEGMDEERISEKKREREDLVAYHKKQLARWVNENQDLSLEKKAKILVVDRDFNFYENQPRTDKYPYTIRCLPFLEDIGSELDRIDPQVIALVLDKEGESDARNTQDFLGKLVAAVKQKYQEAQPFIIVFSGQTNSKDMQEKFSFQNIMSTEGDFSADLLIKMANLIEKKMGTHPKNPPKIFLRKTNPASLAEVTVAFTVLKISETDMLIQSDSPLQTGLNIHLTYPVDMFINVQPAKTQGKAPEYVGLIHALGEVQKKELRRYVNTVFFRDHDAQLSAESEEFKKLNEAKQKEKEEILKKALEDAEAKKASEEPSKA